jgi:hypothetical protein
MPIDANPAKVLFSIALNGNSPEIQMQCDSPAVLNNGDKIQFASNVTAVQDCGARAEVLGVIFPFE